METLSTTDTILRVTTKNSLCVLVGDVLEFVLELGDHRMGLVYFAEECDDGLREVPNLLVGGLE